MALLIKWLRNKFRKIHISGLWTHINKILGSTIKPWDQSASTPFWSKLKLPGMIFETFTTFKVTNGSTALFWLQNWGPAWQTQIPTASTALLHHTQPEITVQQFIHLFFSQPDDLFKENLSIEAQQRFRHLIPVANANAHANCNKQ